MMRALNQALFVSLQAYSKLLFDGGEIWNSVKMAHRAEKVKKIPESSHLEVIANAAVLIVPPPTQTATYA